MSEPSNITAEKAVLGSLLIDPDATFRVLETGLTDSDFWNERNGKIYAAIMGLHKRGVQPDYITVCDRLPDIPASEIAEMVRSTVTPIHAAYYAEIVRDCARRRILLRAAAEVAALACSEKPLGEVYDETAQLFFNLTRPDGIDKSHLYGSDDTLVEYLANQERRAERGANHYVYTGLRDLDEILGDIQPAYLFVVGAKTSIGKTMFLEQIAEYNAQKGRRVAYYHLELVHQSMLDRQMARWSGIDVRRLREGYCGPEIGEAQEVIRQWMDRMIYVHCPGWPIERITTDIARLRAQEGLDLAVVDYLGKVPLGGGRNQNEASQIGLLVEALKTCAERLEIPICTGSQVSRFFKQTGDKRASMADLRGSGEIAEKASQVVMLHRQEGALPDAVVENIEACVEKNADGRLGECGLVHVRGRFLLACQTKPERASNISGKASDREPKTRLSQG